MVDQSKGSFPFQWHFTDRCNLKCAHCYRGDDQQPDLPVSDLERIIDDILDTAVRMRVVPTIAFTGGEPLVRPDVLFSLLDYLKQRGCGRLKYDVHLMTNAVSVDADMARRLGSREEISQIQVSLDGGTAAVNDAIRGPGAFADTVRGVEKLRTLTRAGITLSYTFHRGNAGDMPEFLSLAEQLRVHSLHVTRLAHIGHGSQFDRPMSASEVRDTLTMLYRWERAAEGARARGQERPSVFLARSLFHLVDPEEAIARYQGHRPGQRIGNACAVGIRTSTILSDGTFVLCRRLPLAVGNLLQTPFMDLWTNSELLWQFRTRPGKIRGKCRECVFGTKYGALCAGGAPCVTHSLTGGVETPDPQCWHRPGQD